jgi:hypothetical protein
MAYYQKAANRVGKSFSEGDWWTFVFEAKLDFASFKAWFARWLDVPALTNYQPWQ